MAASTSRERGSPPGYSQSLERGLAILAAFRPTRPLLAVSELARQLELNRSTAHRYVSTLATLGYLRQDGATRKYRLGPARARPRLLRALLDGGA